MTTNMFRLPLIYAYAMLRHTVFTVRKLAPICEIYDTIRIMLRQVAEYYSILTVSSRY